MQPFEIPITDTLDLHTFRPEEIPDLLQTYLTLCVQKQIATVRIIHGKGTGVLKNRVRALLKGMPVVQSFRDAPPEAGGWGATVITLNHAIQSVPDK